jgi:putative transposase
MNEAERREALALRKALSLPWHGPPHPYGGAGAFHLSAACYEHAPFIGVSPARMAECERKLLETVQGCCESVHAWCVLPNHYHVLVQTPNLKVVTGALGRFHGRTSFRWNGEDSARGRHVWHRCSDRRIRSERHFWAVMNYVHHNPVHHCYVERWERWPFSSARRFLDEVGREEAARIWKAYPLLDFGKGWDDAAL